MIKRRPLAATYTNPLALKKYQFVNIFIGSSCDHHFISLHIFLYDFTHDDFNSLTLEYNRHHRCHFISEYRKVIKKS
jgi:hypothetical protein